jgi:hypothetical protein
MPCCSSRGHGLGLEAPRGPAEKGLGLVSKVLGLGLGLDKIVLVLVLASWSWNWGLVIFKTSNYFWSSVRLSTCTRWSQLSLVPAAYLAFEERGRFWKFSFSFPFPSLPSLSLSPFLSPSPYTPSLMPPNSLSLPTPPLPSFSILPILLFFPLPSPSLKSD